VSDAQLACAVLSYRDEPYLVEAVRSVLDQDVPVEVCVVNSGGGDPAARLRAAGIDVPVHSVPERLYVGAARNVGIELTRAPYVAFLAADCVAMPGWGAARLRHHRAGAAGVASVLTNAYPASRTAWAAMLLLHNRRLAMTTPGQRLLYSLSYDRALFARYGLFRGDLRAGEDTEFNARLAERERLVYATDVVTAHRYPTATSRMLRDAFQRGTLQARMQGAIESRGPQRLRVAVRGPFGFAQACAVVARSRPPERGPLLRALPLVTAGTVAYVAGALSTRAGATGD
jgi:glycosyltransferase involved in cell wall biosynthesis